ncbi:EscU/YscU/HrcU family type III secretion system export apparatus switch protein [Thiomicrorhabdus aquaedulcis]|uniref:EscU/YscU/HrcU family type III secretion system export apparatus switch protein n=1 Tax=Thiomicrorhabdus aquaedulcis TaxID=2211106 RepID=UPI000FDB6F24|nr:EscU/YscU/HrcU family type III secretion system export apparatus switch protein [Thiomicrorhabdus aquaedulcis]
MKPPAPRLSDKVAITLQYEGDGPPKVTAKGSGFIADEIIKMAQAHNIPIQKNAPLLGLLSQVELNQEIPEELFEAVVQVLVFAYQLSGKEIPNHSKN